MVPQKSDQSLKQWPGVLELQPSSVCQCEDQLALMSGKILGDGRESSHKRPLHQLTQSSPCATPTESKQHVDAAVSFFLDWWPLTSSIRSPPPPEKALHMLTRSGQALPGDNSTWQSTFDCCVTAGNGRMSFSPAACSALGGSNRALRWWMLTPIAILDLCPVHGLVFTL